MIDEESGIDFCNPDRTSDIRKDYGVWKLRNPGKTAIYSPLDELDFDHTPIWEIESED